MGCTRYQLRVVHQHLEELQDQVHDVQYMNLGLLTICSFPSSGPARKLILPTLGRILHLTALIM